MKTKMVAIVFVLMAMISSFSYAVNGVVVGGDSNRYYFYRVSEEVKELKQELDQLTHEHGNYEKRLIDIKNTVAKAARKIELFKNAVFQHARSEEACRQLSNDYESGGNDTDLSRQFVQQCFARLKTNEYRISEYRRQAHSLLNKINRLRQNSVIINRYMPTLEQQITEIRSMIDYVKLRVDADRAGGAQ